MQIRRYRQDGLEYFNKKLIEALDAKDFDRVTYYKDCIKIFNKWAKADDLPKTMIDSQLKRISVAKSLTLDRILV